MGAETLFDKGLRKIQRYRNWKSRLAVMAGVDFDDVDRFILEYDERIVHAVLREAGMQKDPAIVFETTAKRLISKFLAFATWDHRWYLVEGPAGCGKSFVTSLAVSKITSMPAAYVRVNSFTQNAPSSLLVDLKVGFSLKISASFDPSYVGYKSWTAMKQTFADKQGLLVLDEANKLTNRSIEFLKDLYDETELSIVLIGANIDDRISKDALGPSLYSQIRRRITDSYEIPAISPDDVKLILSHYKIKCTSDDSRLIATRLHRLGDVGTLMEALQKFARKNVKGRWSDVGAGEIMESIEEVMSKIRISFEEDGDESEP